MCKCLIILESVRSRGSFIEKEPFLADFFFHKIILAVNKRKKGKERPTSTYSSFVISERCSAGKKSQARKIFNNTWKPPVSGAV